MAHALSRDTARHDPPPASRPREGAASEAEAGARGEKAQLGVKYRTIVVDPPWDHSDGTGFSFGERAVKFSPNGKPRPRETGQPRTTRPPYGCLTLQEIAALSVSDLAEKNAHLYLWTTNRYLRHSFEVLDAWGFKVSATLTWCKAPMGFMGGAYRSSTEFCHFARRGSLPHKAQAPSRWFTWQRQGWTQSDPAAKHSRKPDPFFDLVESVSPGPYLELFARRPREGWHVWGNEVESDIELVA